MQFLRLTETTELNNAWIIGCLLVGALAGVWVALVISSFLVRQAIRASRIKMLEPFADGIYKRGRLGAAILSFLAAMAAAGLLGYVIWKDLDLQPHVEEAASQLTLEVLLAIGRGTGLVLGLLVAFYALQRAGRRLMARIERWLTQREFTEQQRTYLDKFLTHLPSVVNLGLAYAVTSLAIAALHVPASLAWLITTSVYILLVLTGGRTLVFLSYFLSERLFGTWEAKSKGTRFEEYYAALRRLLPVGQKSVQAIVYVSVATLIVRQFETLEPFSPYGPVIIRVISMFFAASVIVESSRVMIAKLLLARTAATDDAQRRRMTFVSLIQTIVMYIIYFCVAMMVLSDIGIDPTPILAGAGILGLTVGLGAQKIVQDLLSGLFLLFEDQILNGDYIRIGETEGFVEQVTLRLTRIRDGYGRLHILRNGEIQNVINYSRGWTMAVVWMSVAYETDLKEALRVIEEVSGKLPDMFPEHVLDKPELRSLEMAESCLRILIATKVAPGRHWIVKRALTRLLVDGFNENGLEIPYPKSVEIQVDGQPS